MPTPNVNGILETAIYAEDVRRSADFYRRVFAFGTLLEAERLIALDVSGRNVLLLFKAGATGEPNQQPGGVIPGHGEGVAERTGGHFAFAIEANDVPAWRAHLESAGVPVESVVTWPGGATSIYFRDPDHTLVELISRGFWRTY